MATFKYSTRTNSNSNKLVPIYCRLIDGQVDLKVKTGLKIRPDHFNNSTGETRNAADFLKKPEIDKKLRDLKSHVLDLVSLHSSIPEKAWLLEIIEHFHNPPKPDPKETLLGYIESYIAGAPNRVTPKTGKPVCYKQVREYERTLFYIKSYSKEKNRTIDFADIDLNFYYDFIGHLQIQGLAQNTIGKKIQTLKIFLNAANEEGIKVNQQYKSHRFTAISEESESIYLDEHELQRIYNLDLTNRPGLERVRDLFIIGCWTGLRYSDWSKVEMSAIQDGFLEIRQEKTGGMVVIPIHPTVLEILKKYHGKLPQVISNQKFNEMLKQVAKKAKLSQLVHKSITKGGERKSITTPKWNLVTTHTGRRSFATNLYKAGLPTYTIMQVTGHKTEKSFLKYIKITPREHAEKLKQFWMDQNQLKVV